MPSLWIDSDTPATTPTQGGGITTGTWMFADVDIWITSFRYYRGAAFSVGPHVGLIYNTSGSVLAQKTYASEVSGTGWRMQALDTPLHITAGTSFCAAVFSGEGDYAGTSGAFSSQIDNSPLHGYESSAAPGGGNGVFATGGTPTFPTATFGQTAYFADVVYQTTAPNSLPIANAGSTQVVDSGTGVTLNGSASSDPGGSITAYTWRQISGFSITLSSLAAAQPTFTTPMVTATSQLTFGLVVTDNEGGDSIEDTVSVFVSPTRAQYQLKAGVLVPVNSYSMQGGVLV